MKKLRYEKNVHHMIHTIYCL